MAGTFSKEARKIGEPINSNIAVKGNRMLHKDANSAQIIDLDAETITRINFEAKTYSVITFEQMKKALEDASRKLQEHRKDGQADMQFDVSLKDTGAKKVIAGLDAHQMILTLKMKATDEKSGARGGMDVVTDMWIAPQVPGYAEVRAFQKKMAEKLNWSPGGNPMMAGRPDMAKAMAEMYKEGSKMDGMPVYEVVRMGGAMEGMEGAAQQGQPQSQPQSQPQAEPEHTSSVPTSIGGALGGALGGRFGLGRKKKPQQDDSQQAAPQQQQQAQSQPAQAGGAASLMEMTIEMSNFSSATVDGSKMDVPAGFAKVEEDPLGGRSRRGR